MRIPQTERHRDFELFFYSFYEDVLKDVVLAYKSGRWRLKGILSDLLVKTMKSFKREFETIVPVPPTLSSLEERGFDHMLVLAKEVSKKLNLKLVKALVQTGEDRQMGKGLKDRMKNTDRFEMVEFPGLKVALIDDVYTTGSTVKGCVSALRRGGVEKIYVYVLARAKRR